MQAGDELGERERLRQVVVAAGGKAGEAVCERIAGGEEDDRRRQALRPQRLNDIAAVGIREADVHDHRVRRPARHELEHLGGASRAVTRKPSSRRPRVTSERSSRSSSTTTTCGSIMPSQYRGRSQPPPDAGLNAGPGAGLKPETTLLRCRRERSRASRLGHAGVGAARRAGALAGRRHRRAEGNPDSPRRRRDGDGGRDRVHGRPRARAEGRPHVALPRGLRRGDRRRRARRGADRGGDRRGDRAPDRRAPERRPGRGAHHGALADAAPDAGDRACRRRRWSR